MKDKKFKSNYGINSRHKGCAIGIMLNDFLEHFKKITFKNLSHFSWCDYAQPDFILITLFIHLFKVDFNYIKSNYLNDNCFIACWNYKTDKIPQQLSERKKILNNLNVNIEFFNNAVFFK